MRPAASLVGIAEYRDFNAPRDTHSADVLSHITKNLIPKTVQILDHAFFPETTNTCAPHKGMHLHTWSGKQQHNTHRCFQSIVCSQQMYAIGIPCCLTPMLLLIQSQGPIRRHHG